MTGHLGQSGDRPVEYIVRLHPDDQVDAGGLSLRQCPKCFALVVEDFMPDHEKWHERLTKRVHAAGSGMVGLLFTDRGEL